ncbi:fimbrial protein [Tatumella sp. OPLPL6]|uniref:fimbrial protein n=1 Tax=Tatumella sp. OPLPL6 TaxID=1928657 RepID=UPI000C192BC5|nr:fimbrial protein [Tatumella sp. OPLPL6]PIJ44363.1 hypothetical protein BOM24_06035 [Tatumella sp. OPLPL6]
MKYSYIALGILWASCFSANAADSTITITGRLKDNMCSVSVGSQDFTVDLETYATNAFRSVGSTSNAVAFAITLENCGSAASGVKINMTGTTDSSNNTLFRNSTAAGYATGIGVQVLNSAGVVVQPNQSSSNITSTALTANQTNVITYYARMVSTANPVGAGTVSAAANFTLQYD